MVADVIKGGDKQPGAGKAPLCLTLRGFFTLILMEQAPTQVPRVGSLVGIMMILVGIIIMMALHLESDFHNPHASILRYS